MRIRAALFLGAIVTGLAHTTTTASADLLTVSYPPSQNPGELAVQATYHLWIPPTAQRLRAVIVHQHGCGEGAENSGETAALDLHWRALAKRHDAALLSPHYRALGASCRLWCDPRNGSAAVFERALVDLGQRSGHPELAAAPWCLWGHSGGGFWASLMLEKHAERIVAVFCRSGTAMMALGKGEIAPADYPPEAYGVPVVLNPGVKERGHAQFNGAWVGSLDFFNLFRSNGAPVAFAPDPFSSHDCRNSRLLAIPFFDACLRLRLAQSGMALRPVDLASGLWADSDSGQIQPSAGRTNPLSWLPDESCARAFSEYVKTGVTTDTTPPLVAPIIARVSRHDRNANEVIVEWTAEVDFESGIRQFGIYRDGRLLVRLPEDPDARNGFAQFQTISFHDTPKPDAPELRFVDTGVSADLTPTYAVSVINGAGLEGPKSTAVKAPPGRF